MHQFRRVVLSKGVTEIESGAFRNCTSLKKITIPDTVKIIGGFQGCTALEEIQFPPFVQAIDGFAFSDCHNLKQIALPEGIEEIGNYAFRNCSNLKFVRLPASLKKIGNNAFAGCKFKAAFIPAGVQEMDYDMCGWGWPVPDIKYFVSRKNVALKQLKHYKFQCNIWESSAGMLLSDNIIGNTLYYWEENSTKAVIPMGIKVIAGSAFAGHKEIEEIVISSSVREIAEGAFSDCKNLRKITFASPSSVKKIGAMAFASAKVVCVDLPTSVEELAADAFDKKCVVSIDGKMPFYEEKLVKIEKKREKIEKKKQDILLLEEKLPILEAEIENFEGSIPAEIAQIPQLRDQLLDIEKKYDADKKKAREEECTLEYHIKQAEQDIETLLAQRKKVFFLAMSKKRELEESIQAKQTHLKALEEELRKSKETAEKAHELYAAQSAPLKAKLKELEEMQQSRNAQKQTLQRPLFETKAEIRLLSIEIAESEAELDRQEAEIKADHKKWLEQREKATQLQKTQELELERSAILSCLQIPDTGDIPTYKFEPRDTIVEELLLNEAYLRAIVKWNNERRGSEHNRFVLAHQNEIHRVKEINLLLGLDESDGVEALIVSEVSESTVDSALERFTKINHHFGKLAPWKQFGQSASEIKSKKNPKSDLHDKLFAGIDYFGLSSDKKRVLFFSYCIVIIEKNKPMKVLPYIGAKTTVKYTDKEMVTDIVPSDGEVIKEQHKHLNADGSVSKRYKDNPIIKTIRFTEITIVYKKDRVTIPVNSYDLAIQFEKAFTDYADALSINGTSDIYKLILASADLDEIETCIEDLKSAEKEQHKLEKARADEEKKRAEAEKAAAQAAEEEKRKAIIQRQRELNEERKRQAEQKAASEKRIQTLFGDDFDREETKKSDEVPSDTAKFPVEIVGKRQISNTIFKVTLNVGAGFSPKDAKVYFVNTSNESISNKKKITPSATGEGVTVGFVLNSGVDYTTMNKCFLRIESDDRVLGDIEFKLNISFSSDFFDEPNFSDDAKRKTNETPQTSKQKSDINPKTKEPLNDSIVIIPDGTTVLQSQWTDREKEIKRIIVPDSVTKIEDNTFTFLNGAIITVPYSLWTTLNTDCVASSISAGDWCESSVVFKAVKEDGTYFYTYVATRAKYETNDNESLLYTQLWEDDKYIKNYDKGIDEADEGRLKLPAKTTPYLCRLATPYKLSENFEEQFVAYIKRNFAHALHQIALFDCPDMLRVLYRYGMVTPAKQQKVLDALQEANAEECLNELDAISSAKYEAFGAGKKKSGPSLPKEAKVGLVMQEGSFKKTEVKLVTGKTYLYTCPYPVAEGDSVLIGVGNNSESKPSKNSGVAGTVTNAKPTQKLKAEYAVDVAFAFSKDLKTQRLSEFPEFFAEASYRIYVGTHKVEERYYPITFSVRKMLGALTYLQYGALEKEAEVRKLLNELPQLSEQDITSFDWDGADKISVTDMKCAALTALTESVFSDVPGYKEGFLLVPVEEYEEDYEEAEWDDVVEAIKCWLNVEDRVQTFNELLHSEKVKEFLREYVILATAEVLLRCNQTELLKVYFENYDGLTSYASTLMEMAKELGATEGEALIRSYFKK